jgi:squalene synthase HpnC
LPVDHYENFPVASWLVPARLRRPIEAIYGFARAADDIADEGDFEPAERLQALDRYRRALDEIEAGGTPAEPPFPRLAGAIRAHGLPMQLFRDLLDAFAQDVVKTRYATFDELLDYSRRSANPVGRLVLALLETGDVARFPIRGTLVPSIGNRATSPVLQSDSICSALQLVNFWQDVAIDWRKGRVYIPQEDLERFGVAEEQIAEGRADEKWRALMAFECARARGMLVDGAPLGHALPGRLGVEIRATVKGGIAIADKIVARGGDVFRNRPVLGVRDWIGIVCGAVLGKRP